MAECGQLPRNVVDAIASALVRDAEGNVSLNLRLLQSNCDELNSFITCDNNHIPSDAQILNSIDEDACGNPRINIVIPLLNLNDLADVGAVPVNGAGLTYNDDTDTWETRIEWDDLRITPGSFDRPGVSDPVYVAYTPSGAGLSVYTPEFNKNDFVSFVIQLPHGYAEGADIYAHLHWTPGARGIAENGHLVGWKFDYSWANYEDTFPAMQTIDFSDACDGTSHKHQKTTDVLMSGVGKRISSMILCNLRRTDTGADDTWATNTSGNLPLLLEFDFHIPYNTHGSETITSK